MLAAAAPQQLFVNAFTSFWHFPEPPKPQPAPRMIFLLEMRDDGTVAVTEHNCLPMDRSSPVCESYIVHRLVHDMVTWQITEWIPLGHTWQRNQDYDVQVAVGHPTKDCYSRMLLSDLRQQPSRNPVLQEVYRAILSRPEWRRYLNKGEPFFTGH